ncbi:hypothetical protein CEUSTIGMA_g4164.t1 [Chlamydomonas eustigma]|uniref:SAM dependent carboxyl methyltransferase n=1 Tax=Chlamydomonas eustigma TaxID=1157962 RepID=A0A250X0W3_9CHLO|nr:hypothetical protein CEUSTIGMA_g4164.t1 [Chlamydomonas eustigma]|eukprot:GAX76718.1 hypothetical protein CEUSTIGMA_g4164.t1 [Chlamydomonas eustigma]
MNTDNNATEAKLLTLAPTMKQGGFYNKNSTLQGQTVSIGIPLVHSMALTAMRSFGPGEELINIADFGCSQGANSMRVIQAIVRAVTEHSSRESNIPTTVNTSSRPLSLMVFHEDLPSQDWQSLFLQVEKKDGSSYLNLPGCQKRDSTPHVFSAAIGRSFYERMFPDRFLHMAVSFTAVHWISQRPDVYPGASWFYNSRNSPEESHKAGANQFYSDFENFLRLRAIEVKEGGQMYISMSASPLEVPELSQKNFVQDDLDAAIKSMLDSGLMTKDHVKAITLPMYIPTERDLKKVFERVADVWEPSGFSYFPEANVYISCWDDFVNGFITAEHLGQQYEDFWRAVSESWMTGQLQAIGLSAEAATQILNEMYGRVRLAVSASPRQSFSFNLMGSLRRKESVPLTCSTA